MLFLSFPFTPDFFLPFPLISFSLSFPASLTLSFLCLFYSNIFLLYFFFLSSWLLFSFSPSVSLLQASLISFCPPIIHFSPSFPFSFYFFCTGYFFFPSWRSLSIEVKKKSFKQCPVYWHYTALGSKASVPKSGVWSTRPLPLLSGPLWPGLEVLLRSHLKTKQIFKKLFIRAKWFKP